MTRLTRWLAVALAVSVAAAGWFGWRQYQWREAYYDGMTGQLIYDVNMAKRQLVRARETGDYQQKLDAMAGAFSYLVSAHNVSWPLLDRLAPHRQGKPAYMPSMYIPMLVQYARDLSPEMPDPALKRRIELLEGLENALRAGLTERRLKQSLDDFFRPMVEPRGEFPPGIRFEDENDAHVVARQQGAEIRVRVGWTHTFKIFPNGAAGQLLLIRSPGVQVSSDAGEQVRMGQGSIPPFAVEQWGEQQHAMINRFLPEWKAGQYTAVRIPEGLPQTLTLRGGGGEMYLFPRPGSWEKAMLVPLDWIAPR